nr:hypothetical protein [Tanacetum cinerariifolium]
LFFVGTEYQLADLFTKALPVESFLENLPEHLSDTKVFTMKMEILLEPTSNKLLKDSNYLITLTVLSALRRSSIKNKQAWYIIYTVKRLVPAKSNSYYQAFNDKSLFGEIDKLCFVARHVAFCFKARSVLLHSSLRFALRHAAFCFKTSCVLLQDPCVLSQDSCVLSYGGTAFCLLLKTLSAIW